MVLINRFIIVISILVSQYSIVFAQSGMLNIIEETSTIILNSNDVSGWNHLDTSSVLLNDIKHPSNSYQLETLENINDANQQLNVSVVLLRKIANWEQQHTNGIKINLAERGMSFGDFKSFSVGIVYDQLNSIIPRAVQAINYYDDVINKGIVKSQWLKEMLSESPVISFTLFGEAQEEQAIATPMAVFNYSASLKNMENTVIIKAADFNYFWQQHYQEQKVGSATLESQKIMAMLITLDTSNNRTLRSYISTQGHQEFPDTMKEMFLELAVTFIEPTFVK
jgi:hypothetical protein